MPDMKPGKQELADPGVAFSQALIAAANQMREDLNLERSEDLTEAAVIVVSKIVSTTVEGAGTNHVPHPDGATIETASRAACFMAACLSGLSVNLRDQGIHLDVPAVYTRAGFLVFQWYSPQEESTIISSGGDAFKKLVAAASDHPNVQKWIADVQNHAAAYVLTGNRNYVKLLRKEYLSLWQARVGEKKRRGRKKTSRKKGSVASP